ncbi:hypothetical protein [Andreprevotia chitinilytica]|uniref:hypothetical protein n=1 Tax=Andreprevotia chitinilytica TaxID=396808 RepID=UPI0005595A33|nr:hypothetical protein [Andreprevotia chitinilytica]
MMHLRLLALLSASLPLVLSAATLAGETSWSANGLFGSPGSLGGGGQATQDRFAFGSDTSGSDIGNTLPPPTDWDSRIDIRLEQQHWHFDSPAAFGGNAPWGDVTRSSVGVRLDYQGSPGWRYSVEPSIAYAGEAGANQSASMGLGALFAASHQVQPNLLLGLGAGVFRQADQTRVFPYVLVDWHINNQWRLANPNQTSFTGPAGVELSYQSSQAWQLAAGGSWRSDLFRLSDNNGVARNGVGEASAVPVYLRFGYSMQPGWKIDIYAAALFGGKLNVDDSNGNAISSDHYRPSRMIGVNFNGRF